jgi:hypothetical protein
MPTFEEILQASKFILKILEMRGPCPKVSYFNRFYINKFFGKTYRNNVMTIAMKCQSAPSTLNDTIHIHSLLTIVHDHV